jgi:hypothetical protein
MVEEVLRSPLEESGPRFRNGHVLEHVTFARSFDATFETRRRTCRVMFRAEPSRLFPRRILHSEARMTCSSTITIDSYSIASNHQDAMDTYTEVAKTVVDFMVDCKWKDSDVNASHLHLAFEYAYQPLPRFWRDFDLATVVEAVSESFPEWRSAAQARKQTAEEVLREVEEVLHMNAADEANAELLMALPPRVRPTDEQAAADWICAELEKRGLESELRFAERDGWRCGERALEVAHSLEQATLGIAYERLGTQTARMVRDQILTMAHA